MNTEEPGGGASGAVERRQQARAAVRNSITGLSAVQVGVVAWMLVDRSRSGQGADPDLNLIVFLAAFVSVLVVARLAVSNQRRALGRGLGPLCGVAGSLSVMSFGLVDYGTLREGGLILPTVLVVSIVLALRRRQG